jgi:starvation-inducible DNA-binding protein
MPTTPNTFPRQILNDDAKATVSTALQRSLVDLLDLSLILKQAHWNLVGDRFRSFHLELDEILEDTRAGSDEVAERMAQIGSSPDGRSSTISSSTSLKDFPAGFIAVDQAVTAVADAMAACISTLRSSRAAVEDVDAITEDMLIGIIAPLEKHLWMVQSQEVEG